jgi:class 3 adenylate cyclase/tetratricopeptide (TPR) repeat protein
VADYCVFCGAAMNQSWLCAACGAAAPAPWPRSEVAMPAEDAEVRDELRPVTALFADVVGSTALGEKLDPAEVKVLIGECVTRMTGAVESYGGVVRSFMGDGIAAFFGLDGAREDDAIRAGLAALRILDVISEYAAEIHAAWLIPSVAVRVGINSGRCATGLVGSAEPQYVALGDPVNVAARLQGRAEPGSIVVGAATASQLASRFEVERLGHLELRGRTQLVEGWKLCRYVGEPVAGHMSSFVGRSAELGVLDAVLDELSLGRGRIVVVLGEAGIGKSRLLSECRGRAHSNVTWLSGRCAHQRVLRPYGPFVEMLSRWLEIDRDTPHVVTRVRLLARLRETLEDDAMSVLPYLSQLLAIQGPEEIEDEVPATEQRGHALRRAYASWITALADDRPVVLAVDDVERADASTKLLLAELFRLTLSIPLVVVIAMRDDRDAPGWDVRVEAVANHSHRTLEVRLGALGGEEAEEFIGLNDRDGLITPAMRCELRLRAEGNALFLEELTRTALEAIGRPVSDSSDRWSNLEIPVALEGLLLARIDRVSARARSVLQVAAVIGRRFPMWALETAAEGVDLAQSLETLVREGLIQPDGLRPSRYFAFRHGLYQEAALATLPQSRKRQLHETAANALEGGPRDRFLEEIAGHYLASGNELKALEYLELAARRAESLSSLSEAADLTSQAIDLSHRVGDADSTSQLRVLAAELARQMGRYEEASSIWQDELAIATDDKGRAKALLEVAGIEFDLGHNDRAVVACQGGLDSVTEPATRRDLLLLMASIELRQLRLAAVKELLEQVDGQSPAMSTRARIQWLSLWAGYHASTGDLDQAETYGLGAVQLVEGSGDLALELRAKRDLGIIHFLKGRLTEARSSLTGVYEMALGNGFVLRAQEAVANLVTVQLHLGNLDEGLETGLDALGWIQAPAWRAALLVNLGEIEHELGRPAARQHIIESKAICDKEQDRATGALATLLLAEMSLAEGDVRSAEEAAATVLLGWDGSGRADVQIHALVGLAEVALIEEHFEGAMEYVRRAQHLTYQADRTEVPMVLRAVGRVHLCMGELDAALDAIREAREVSQVMSMRLEEARSLVLLGTADQSLRRLCFNEARAIFAECGSELGLAELRSALTLVQSA